MRRRLHYTAGSRNVGPPVALVVEVPNCNHCTVGAIEVVLVEHIRPFEEQLSMVR